MARPRFNLPSEQILRDHVRLTGPEAHHANVRRLSQGEEVSFFDGHGNEAVAVVTHVDRHGLEFKIIERPPPLLQPRPRIHLGLGLVRWERLRLVAEKATELGVASIWPLSTERSQNYRRDQADKMKRVVIEALKQCHRSVGPAIEPVMSLDQALKKSPHVSARIILDRDGLPLVQVLTSASAPDLVLLVGPEGGFSDAEKLAAEAAGFSPAGLARAILRTETAALAAVAQIQAFWGEAARERKN